MFKRDNEQEEKYSQAQQQQQQHNMRGAPQQYGQQHQYHRQYKNDATTTSAGETYDAANIRMRHLQQQQQRIHHMQNVNSHKQPYPKSMPSPLSSIPETIPKSPGASSNIQHVPNNELVNSSMNAPSSPSLLTSFSSHIPRNVRQNRNNLVEGEDSKLASISNVMEGLINVAESVVASKSSTHHEFVEPNDMLQQEQLPHNLSMYIYLYLI